MILSTLLQNYVFRPFHLLNFVSFAKVFLDDIWEEWNTLGSGSQEEACLIMITKVFLGWGLVKQEELNVVFFYFIKQVKQVRIFV